MDFNNILITFTFMSPFQYTSAELASCFPGAWRRAKWHRFCLDKTKMMLSDRKEYITDE